MALANHRTWLLGKPKTLFSFFERRLINPLCGFYDLDEEGRPTATGYGAAQQARPLPFRNLKNRSRLRNRLSIAYLMDRSDADVIIDHGISFVERPPRLRRRWVLLGSRL
jgi:hypothetical protein